MQKDIEKKIRDIIFQQVESLSDISHSISIKENLVLHGLDSLSFAKIMVEIEQQFDITVELEDMVMNKCISIELLIEFVSRRLS